MNIVFETEFILATRKDSRGSGENVGKWLSNHSKGRYFDSKNGLSPFYKPKIQYNGKYNYYDVNATEYSQYKLDVDNQINATLEQRAKDLSQTINNDRINVRINNEVTYHYDLNYTRPSGQFHRGIPVPHITRSNLNISPKGTFYNQDNTWVRSATHHDIEFLLKALKIK